MFNEMFKWRPFYIGSPSMRKTVERLLHLLTSLRFSLNLFPLKGSLVGILPLKHWYKINKNVKHFNDKCEQGKIMSHLNTISARSCEHHNLVKS